MLKYILRLVAASTSFVALLFITHPAIATTPITNLDQQWRLGSAYPAGSPVVSLNVVSSSLQLAKNQGIFPDVALDHFGCACATCIQSLEQKY
ncbi:MAG: hypothetical protein RLZZ74_2160 [Cyanobacteriota bacterium]|jgi:hypothetical protein